MVNASVRQESIAVEDQHAAGVVLQAMAYPSQHVLPFLLIDPVQQLQLRFHVVSGILVNS